MNLNGERGQEHYRAVVAECQRIVDACEKDTPTSHKEDPDGTATLVMQATAYEAMRAQLDQLREVE